jgi:hypothetical protein
MPMKVSTKTARDSQQLRAYRPIPREDAPVVPGCGYRSSD